MAQPYVGEIRMFAGSFPPKDWEFCNGQELSIAQHTTLFQLIGTTYGGDGQSTFRLPNLQSRIPIHMVTEPPSAPRFPLGQMAGVEAVTLTTEQIPVHNHAAIGAAVTGDQTSLDNALPANSVTITPYLNSPPDAAFSAQAIGPAGGSQPHDNTQPFICIHYIISLFGLFPNPT